MKYIIIIFLFFSYKSVIAEDLLEPPIEIDKSENILNLNPVNLKKLKTRDIEKLLIGNVALGYFDNGDRYEETFSFINPGEEGNFNLKIIDNNDEVYTGTYKIVQSKVCFLTNGSDDWQCAVLYRNKENNNKYYWAQKNIIYAKITNIVNKEEYVELKNQQLKEEEERIAEEKRRAEEEKRKEEERIAEEKRKAEEKQKEEERIAEEKRRAEELIERKLSLLNEETEIEKAQSYLVNVKKFLKLNPGEFDIIQSTEFIIATKPIMDGDFNEELKAKLQEFKIFLKNSDVYVVYENGIYESDRENKLKKVNDLIFKIENNISTLKEFMIENQDSLYLEQWLSNIKAAEKTIQNLESYQELIDTSIKLDDLIDTKIKIDISVGDGNKSIELLKSYLIDNIDNDLAPLILEQIKKLEDAISTENVEKITDRNKIVEEFVYETFIKPEEERIAEEKRKEEERIAEEKRKAEEEKRKEEERIAEEKRKAEEEKKKEEERIAEQKKKLIEDKYKKFKAKNDYQKNIIKFLHTIDAEFEDIRFSRRDNNIEIVNLNIEEIRINSLEIENINKDYLNIVINLINFEGNEVIKQFDEFVYAGQIFDNIKLSGLEINEDKDSYLKIGEIGFSDLDFEKYDQIKSLINIDYLDNTYNNFLSFVLSMKFDKIYFRDLVLEDSSEKMSIEYFEISDWNEFSFEKIQIDDGYFKSYENEVIFENLLIEEYLIDSEEMNKLISSNEALENLIIYNDFSQIFNSLKSLENFEIKNLQTRIENSDFYSFDTAKIRDLEFNYFGNSKDIKVPTSLEIEIIGSSFNPGVVNQEASILANELGYEEIKFDFITSWFWDTKKNNIEFNLENGLTDAGSISILTNISDLNSDILSIQGAPLMTYLMTTPKLKEFNITVSDKSLKNKIINYAAKQQNMSSDQFRNFLSQSLSLLATTFGVNAENYEEYFTSISNFINDSDKLIISLEPNKPISINDLMPDIMSQNYSGIFDKMKLEIRN